MAPRPRMQRFAGLALASALGAGSASAQAAAASTPAEPPAILRVAFAADAATTAPAAVAWLCEQYLPQRPEWPPSLPRGAAFAITLSAGVLTVQATAVPLPNDTCAAASLQFGTGPAATGTLARDGLEDWLVPTTLSAPPDWLDGLRELRALDLDQPRSLDLAVLIGHLAGPLVDGSERAAFVHLGALCGEVTFASFRRGDQLRVRGRSDGGLLLPALLLAALSDPARTTKAPRSLRAFAARDGDRNEATRQLLREAPPVALRTLRAMLHGDDELRLAAIDTLVRRAECEELPRIVAAALPSLPLATTAAADAVRALWLDADAGTRQRTRAALARSQAPDLRRLDTEQLARRIVESPAAPDLTAPDHRARALLAMLVLGICLYGLWLRERTRLHGATA